MNADTIANAVGRVFEFYLKVEDSFKWTRDRRDRKARETKLAIIKAMTELDSPQTFMTISAVAKIGIGNGYPALAILEHEGRITRTRLSSTRFVYALKK